VLDCGERIALGLNSLIVVAGNPKPVPQGGPSILLLVDASTGESIRSMETAVESLELVSVRRALG
jgi:hypothetical protein